MYVYSFIICTINIQWIKCKEQSWYWCWRSKRVSLSSSLINLTHHPLLTINTIKTAREREREREHFLPTFHLQQVVFQLSLLLLALVFGCGKWKCPWKSDLLCAVCFASNGFLAFSSPIFFLGTEREMGIVGRKIRYSCSTPPNHRLLILGFLFAFLLQTVAVKASTLNYTRYRPVSSLRLERIQRHLDKINKPPLLTIEVSSNIIAINIICVFVCLWYCDQWLRF